MPPHSSCSPASPDILAGLIGFGTTSGPLAPAWRRVLPQHHQLIVGLAIKGTRRVTATSMTRGRHLPVARPGTPPSPGAKLPRPGSRPSPCACFRALILTGVKRRHGKAYPSKFSQRSWRGRPAIQRRVRPHLHRFNQQDDRHQYHLHLCEAEAQRLAAFMVERIEINALQSLR